MAGGWISRCDECNENYCGECSQSLDKAILAHPGLSCRESQLPSDDQFFIQRHVKFIEEELLPLRCPYKECNKVFDTFDGCQAVTCNYCHHHFCGKCFKCCPDNGAAHQHAERCRENGAKFGLFLEPNEWHGAMCKMKQNRVQEYFKNLSPKIKRVVLEKVKPSLKGQPGGYNIVVKL